MDHQGRDRSPSVGHQLPHINRSNSPSPGTYPPSDASVGLGLGLDQSSNTSFPGQQPSNDFPYTNNGSNFLGTDQQSGGFDPNQPIDPSLSFTTQGQSTYLGGSSFDTDFSLFPPSTQPEQFNQPLFDQPSLNPADINNMSSPQISHSPTPAHLLKPDPGSSPAFTHPFSSSPGTHSRHASLGPEAALLPGQMGDWSQAQFQGHRRSPSEFSDVSSAAPSPHLATVETFDQVESGHSPMQRASDAGLYQEVLGIGSFSLSDPQHSPNHPGRSPSHSPAISPRILPSQLPEMNQPSSFGVAPQTNAFGAPVYNLPGHGEAFPSLHQQAGLPDMGQMQPPAINIDFAPNSRQNSFEPPKPSMDVDSLTPPERGRPRSRPRAVTDPFNSGGASILARPNPSGSLSPHMGSELSSRSDSSRSLSPLDRQSTNAQNRRRQSTSAVPNNVIALRLADPEYQNSQDNGNAKRVQKHPATFQCTLCPKRFTRAYNLRSHLRTHTDERPFVCTVCGKAFARQHDRKRHESLHSGEKKFVCKGELKAGGQWGCGRRFARADALGRHFRSEAGRICIKPLLDEEMLERQRLWQEQRMQQNMAQNMGPPGAMGMDPNAYPLAPDGGYALPAALLAQYPALAQMNWSGQDMGSGMEDELSGRSSFDASDYDDGDDNGYVSGPGTGFGEGSMTQNYGEMGYASDYGQPSR